ncbi:MAG TPA: TIGR00269 family protein [Candidatus Bathyarchaeia archaeon]|nr:TIGR00269 family protein [Candidatus Bathyarchaeia archaeon]
MKCDKCSASAIIFQRYSGLHLCKAHFFVDVEKKIKKEVRKERIEGTLAVAFSGGKDSAVVLAVLNDLLSRRGVEIVAITIDEGIAGYRDKALESAAMLVAELGVRWQVASFDEYFGVRVDRLDERACTVCGILRRSLLNRVAKTVGASTLATGHNLDDEAQTVLMNYLRGDIDRLLRLDHPAAKEGLVRRVKPLKYVPEREVALYAILRGIPISLDECRYSAGVFRAEVRTLLNELEPKHAGTKYALVRGLERILGLTRREPFQLAHCVQCEEPAVKALCQSCEILRGLQSRENEAAK